MQFKNIRNVVQKYQNVVQKYQKRSSDVVNSVYRINKNKITINSRNFPLNYFTYLLKNTWLFRNSCQLTQNILLWIPRFHQDVTWNMNQILLVFPKYFEWKFRKRLDQNVQEILGEETSLNSGSKTYVHHTFSSGVHESLNVLEEEILYNRV